MWQATTGAAAGTGRAGWAVGPRRSSGHALTSGSVAGLSTPVTPHQERVGLTPGPVLPITSSPWRDPSRGTPGPGPRGSPTGGGRDRTPGRPSWVGRTGRATATSCLPSRRDPSPPTGAQSSWPQTLRESWLSTDNSAKILQELSLTRFIMHLQLYLHSNKTDDIFSN